jgi:serine/threonine protein kinase
MAWIEGERVGPYLLKQQLGQGGMATVYLAYHEQLDRDVALKVMHRNFLDDATFVARFTREAQIVAILEHPNIVPVYDFDDHDGLPFLVMKYIKGQTLKRKLIKKPLTLDEILHVIGAVGSALNYAHEKDVLHRDIKPSNIVIDTDNVPYLADFGLARLASSGESTMSADVLLGTPHYISPEQARGDKNLDRRTDIYSLGVVLYELLVGHVPFTADTPYSIIHDHIYTPLPEPTKINPEIPLPVEAVLYKALAKNREDRHATANELVDDLRVAINESNLTELDPSRVSRATASLAQRRAEAVHALQTPTGIDNPLQQTKVLTSSEPLRTATLKKKPLRWYEQERAWTAGGCASFLVICFLACGVLLNMSTNIQELMALSASGAFDKHLNVEGVPHELVPLLIRVEDYNDYPIFVAPTLPLDLVQSIQESHPDEALVYLSLGVSQWSNNDNVAARQAIEEGYALAEDKVQYLTSAAYAADTMGDRNASVIYAIMSLESARADAIVFEQLRPVVGKYIYDNAASLSLADETEFDTDLIGDFQLSESLVAQFAAARFRIVNGNERLAQIVLRRAEDTPILQPEFNLLRAELALLQGNSTDASTTLSAILEGDAPEWVEERADELLEQIEQ